MASMQAVQATDGAKGFDTNTPLTTTLANDFASDGYDFCVRYVARGGRRGRNDLSSTEVEAIIDSGLALMVVQHVSPVGWSPSGALGEMYGENAARQVSSLNLPKKMNVWLDLEGVKYGTSEQDITDYCNEWYNHVSSAGYTPGIYIGSDSYLSASELYYDLKFDHYWKSMSRVPAPIGRGFQMIQEVNPNRKTGPAYGEYFENGIWIDRDHIQRDHGRLASTTLPIWAIKDSGSSDTTASE